MSQQCALAAQKFHQGQAAQTETWPVGKRTEFSTAYLLWLDLTCSPEYSLEFSIQSRTHQHPQTRATILITCMHCPFYTERLKGIEVFETGEEQARGKPYCCLWYVKGMNEEVEEKCFLKACSNWTRSKSFQLKLDKYRWDIRKNFTVMSVIRHWEMLPREWWGVPSWQVFKVQFAQTWWDALNDISVHGDRFGLDKY